MNKVTMQDIADSLGISRVSVWNALNNRGGLSEELRTTIFLKAAELGYKKIPTQSVTPVRKNISLIICQPEISPYWNEITHHIAKELSQIHYNLIYIYLPSKYELGYTLPQNLSDGSIDGTIIVSAFDLNMLHLLNTLKIPKVYLDTSTLFPLANINGDLVLLEGEEQLRTITNHIIQKGRTDLAFIGDINYCRTNYDRYTGYISSLTEHHLPVSNASYITWNGNDISKAEIREYLDTLSNLPDAFICVNDYIASIVTNYMQEKGIQIPDDIFVTGFDRILDYFPSDDFITSAIVKTSSLAKRLVSQLLFRINNPKAAFERIYIRCKIFYGRSTDF